MPTGYLSAVCGMGRPALCGRLFFYVCLVGEIIHSGVEFVSDLLQQAPIRETPSALHVSYPTLIFC